MSDNTIRKGVNAIADQLCRAVDNDFSFRVQTGSSDVDLQKLAILTNFLLESMEQNLQSLEDNRQELEQRVLERTKRLDLIVKGAGVGIWEWDPDNDLVRVSTQWLGSLVGAKNESCFSLDYWLKLMHPADVGAFKKALHLHLCGVAARFEAEYRMADNAGGYRWVLCRGVGDRDPATGQVTWMSGTLSDVTQMRFRDSETGLANGDYFELIANERLAKGEPASMVMLSIANRSLLAESLSRRDTQQLTEALSARLLGLLGPHALLAYLSGGLYGFLLPQADDTLLHAFAQDLLSLFEEPFEIGEQRLWLSCHIGACNLVQIRAQSAEDGIQAAQLALREVRNRHGSDFRLFEDAMRTSSLERLETEQILRNALRYDWVAVKLQPIIDFDNGNINGYEVLARIEHPNKGTISPARFIPVAEETGLIRQLSDVVMRQALQLAKHPLLQALHPKGFNLGVNLSAVQLHDSNLPERLHGLLQAHGVAPERIKLELTESAVMADPEGVKDVIRRLRELGFKLALDDFGTGYSSLGYLRQLPLDILKVDRSLVSGLHRNPDQYAILEMVMGLSAKLGLRVVVEGIETEDEFLQVLALGGRFGQGFLFSRPVAVEELPQAHEKVRVLFRLMQQAQ
ncbi:EAL domain-containing protein [Gallaecimonas xiamenensis]|uniref:PAS/PAC sensor-containing diguanylate cyclase/phosphodiesterase n=1 Tax=Gallaecimonas xiamenensis 3-C-1 TaxID=745411 RepID=K2JT97_9GAMM|nr:EAL domain-containing protein [Gallaecimonas xiamenensis]EKE68400.1 PAS/PAC sensor-containing diguanylate cyclase/phosphodiesterase [Gallaecimonas xiamenensis 3-C-1]